MGKLRDGSDHTFGSWASDLTSLSLNFLGFVRGLMYPTAEVVRERQRLAVALMALLPH